MSDSVWSHRRQPTRLPRPWDSPGKNTGVGCHFLLQYMKAKSESEVALLCPTPSNPMNCSPAGSSVHGIFQARVLEWGTIAFSVCESYTLKKVTDVIYSLGTFALSSFLELLSINNDFTWHVLSKVEKKYWLVAFNFSLYISVCFLHNLVRVHNWASVC